LADYLKILKIQQVTALLALNWSFRRIERETGADRGTVSKYARVVESKPAEVFPGSGGDESGVLAGFAGGERAEPAKVTAGSSPKPANVFLGSRSAAAAYRTEIQERVDAGLTAQRIYQDLVEEHSYGDSYEPAKRFVRKLAPERQAVGVMHSAAGEEAQVDFSEGPPTLDPGRGEWRRPWVFRMTPCCSRHGHEEAVWDQKLPSFLRLHENAFQFFGPHPMRQGRSTRTWGRRRLLSGGRPRRRDAPRVLGHPLRLGNERRHEFVDRFRPQSVSSALK